MHKKLFILSLILSCFVFSYSSAQTVFSDYLPNARSVGLGWSAVALASDPSAGYWNPASLAFLIHDRIMVNVNDVSQFDLIGFSKFFPPKIGLGINVLRSRWSESKFDLSSIAVGYRINSAFSIGSNVNLGRRENGAFFSSFGLGIFMRSFPDYRNELNFSNSVWKWFRSNSMKDKLSIGLTFHNLPIQNLKNTQQLRAAVALKFIDYVPLLHLGYHLSPKNSSLHLGSQIDIIKNISIYLGIKDFDANKFAFGSLTNFGPFYFELSCVPETKQYYFSFSLSFSEKKKYLAQKYKNSGALYVKKNNIRSGLYEYEKAFAYDQEDRKLNFLISVLEKKVENQQKKIDSLLTEAIKFEKQKSYANAFQIYKYILEVDLHNAAARKHLKSLSPKLNKYIVEQYDLGKALYRNKNTRESKEAFKRILTITKTHTGAKKYIARIDSISAHNFDQFYLRGIGYYKQRNYIRAHQEITKALQLNPTHKKALEYKKLINNVLENKQKRIKRLLAEAERYERNKFYIKANNRYRQVLNLDKRNRKAIEKVKYYKKHIVSVVGSKFQKAKQLYNTKDFLAATGTFREILSIDPTHGASKTYLKRSQQGLNASIEEHYNLAQNYFAQEKWNEASEECAAILSLNNKHNGAKRLQGEIAQHISLKQLNEKAEQYYLVKDYRRAYEKYSQILLRNPENNVAKEYQQICEKEIRTKIEELFNRGMVSYSEGDYQEAIKEWNKVLQLDANHKSTLEYIQKATERIEVLSDIK
ncbi:tetratricopeptide repeat protein [candidate division KSB1 bacterium]|nr:tetratricopeptide repeat protein [candidate division KSB1 bacterium]